MDTTRVGGLGIWYGERRQKPMLVCHSGLPRTWFALVVSAVVVVVVAIVVVVVVVVTTACRVLREIPLSNGHWHICRSGPSIWFSHQDSQ